MKKLKLLMKIGGVSLPVVAGASYYSDLDPSSFGVVRFWRAALTVSNLIS